MYALDTSSRATIEQHYDKKVHGNELKEGDQVLMKNVREKGGTGKLKSHWERQISCICN